MSVETQEGILFPTDDGIFVSTIDDGKFVEVASPVDGDVVEAEYVDPSDG